MAGRKAPRPLPRPVRWLAMFLALVFVVSLGMVVNHESSKATGGASDASSSTPAKSPKGKKTAKTGGYGGLKELVKLFVFGVCFINRVPFVRGMRPRVGRGPVSSWSLCAPR